MRARAMGAETLHGAAMTLEELGWTPEFREHFEALDVPGLVPGRVVRQDPYSYSVMTARATLMAELTGPLRASAADGEDRPAVGDWVALLPYEEDEIAFIQALLPRRGGFARQKAGTVTGAQVVAANIDTIFIVMGLDGDFNLRRLERYLALCWNSGAMPVVLLNKTDLSEDLEGQLTAVEAVAAAADIHALSAKHGDGFDAVEGYLAVGRTIAFIGSSGAGKSTMVNRLLGVDRMAVGAVRGDDDRGRHTTSHRELIVLPGRGIVVDTPGMRELQMWGDEDALRGAFPDIEDLTLSCKFRDCAHEAEPGCAVRAAVEDGALDAARLQSYLKLKRELASAALRQSEASKREVRLRARKQGRLYKAAAKHSRRRKEIGEQD